MEIGQETCSYLVIDEGNQSLKPLYQIPHNELYKDLAIDNIVICESTVNNDRISRGYYTRFRKICLTELFYYRKTVFPNAFVVSVMILTFVILEWSVE